MFFPKYYYSEKWRELGYAHSRVLSVRMYLYRHRRLTPEADAITWQAAQDVLDSRTALERELDTK